MKDKEYVTLVKQCFKDTILQYMRPGGDCGDENVPFVIDDQLFWEMLKLEIRGRTIPYCCKKKATSKLEESLIEREIQNLEESLAEKSTEDLWENLNSKKLRLEEIRAPRTEAIMLRSRARWVEQPTKYFCALEKRNYTNRIINKVVKEGQIITDPKGILREQADFYKTLYKSSTKSIEESQSYSQEFLVPENLTILNEEQHQSCEGEITKQELLNALKKMANNKSPGSDGYQAEFYKFFWRDLGHFLWRSLSHGYNSGILSITQRQGIISCLPKGDKPRQFLKNWRPISLLNTDYKILSAALANRMKVVLPK